jgi:hypothetical protein
MALAGPCQTRCRAVTRNPNCFCTQHQSLTRVPRFEWVHTLDIVIARDLEDDFDILFIEPEFLLIGMLECSRLIGA